MTKKTDSIIYGIHAVEELIVYRSNEIDRIYFDSRHTKGSVFTLLKRCRKQKIPCQCVPLQKISQIAGTLKHQGVVAVCTAKPYNDLEKVFREMENATSPPLFIVPASCEDPRNFGALIRTCAAFCVTALLLERKQTAPLNATVAKAAAGMLEHVAIVKPNNLEKVITDLKLKGFLIVGARAGTHNKPEDIDFLGPTVIIIGGEHRGIPPYLKRLCTEFVSIPIAETTGSLNVSTAASILIYECVKQRGFCF